jgi:hypothetical protein
MKRFLLSVFLLFHSFSHASFSYSPEKYQALPRWLKTFVEELYEEQIKLGSIKIPEFFEIAAVFVYQTQESARHLQEQVVHHSQVYMNSAHVLNNTKTQQFIKTWLRSMFSELIYTPVNRYWIKGDFSQYMNVQEFSSCINTLLEKAISEHYTQNCLRQSGDQTDFSSLYAKLCITELEALRHKKLEGKLQQFAAEELQNFAESLMFLEQKNRRDIELRQDWNNDSMEKISEMSYEVMHMKKEIKLILALVALEGNHIHASSLWDRAKGYMDSTLTWYTQLWQQRGEVWHEALNHNKALDLQRIQNQIEDDYNQLPAQFKEFVEQDMNYITYAPYIIQFPATQKLLALKIWAMCQDGCAENSARMDSIELMRAATNLLDRCYNAVILKLNFPDKEDFFNSDPDLAQQYSKFVLHAMWPALLNVKFKLRSGTWEILGFPEWLANVSEGVYKQCFKSTISAPEVFKSLPLVFIPYPTIVTTTRYQAPQAASITPINIKEQFAKLPEIYRVCFENALRSSEPRAERDRRFESLYQFIALKIHELAELDEEKFKQFMIHMAKKDKKLQLCNAVQSTDVSSSNAGFALGVYRSLIDSLLKINFFNTSQFFTNPTKLCELACVLQKKWPISKFRLDVYEGIQGLDSWIDNICTIVQDKCNQDNANRNAWGLAVSANLLKHYKELLRDRYFDCEIQGAYTRVSKQYNLEQIADAVQQDQHEVISVFGKALEKSIQHDRTTVKSLDSQVRLGLLSATDLDEDFGSCTPKDRAALCRQQIKRGKYTVAYPLLMAISHKIFEKMLSRLPHKQRVAFKSYTQENVVRLAEQVVDLFLQLEQNSLANVSKLDAREGKGAEVSLNFNLYGLTSLLSVVNYCLNDQNVKNENPVFTWDAVDPRNRSGQTSFNINGDVIGRYYLQQKYKRFWEQKEYEFNFLLWELQTDDVFQALALPSAQEEVVKEHRAKLDALFNQSRERLLQKLNKKAQALSVTSRVEKVEDEIQNSQPVSVISNPHECAPSNILPVLSAQVLTQDPKEPEENEEKKLQKQKALDHQQKVIGYQREQIYTLCCQKAQEIWIQGKVERSELNQKKHEAFEEVVRQNIVQNRTAECADILRQWEEEARNIREQNFSVRHDKIVNSCVAYSRSIAQGLQGSQKLNNQKCAEELALGFESFEKITQEKMDAINTIKLELVHNLVRENFEKDLRAKVRKLDKNMTAGYQEMNAQCDQEFDQIERKWELERSVRELQAAIQEAGPVSSVRFEPDSDLQSSQASSPLSASHAAQPVLSEATLGEQAPLSTSYVNGRRMALPHGSSRYQQGSYRSHQQMPELDYSASESLALPPYYSVAPTYPAQNPYGYYDAHGQWMAQYTTAYGYQGPTGEWYAWPRFASAWQVHSPNKSAEYAFDPTNPAVPKLLKSVHSHNPYNIDLGQRLQ